MTLQLAPYKRRRDFEWDSFQVDGNPTSLSAQRGSGESVYRSTAQHEPMFNVEMYEENQNHIRNIMIRQEWSQCNQYFEQTVNQITISDPETQAQVQQVRSDLRMVFSECARGFENVEGRTGAIGTVIEDIIKAMRLLEQYVMRITKWQGLVES